MDLPPLALIARLAALVPTPRRHLTRYCGVLSSHSRLRSRVVPQAEAQATATEKPEKPARKSKYIPWAELLRRTFRFEVVCQRCQAPLRLVALVKTQDIAKKILTAMHLPTEVPEPHPARPPPGAGPGGAGRGRVGELKAERRHGTPEGIDYALCSIRLDAAHSRPGASTRIRLADHAVAAQVGASAVEEGCFRAETPPSFHLGACSTCTLACSRPWGTGR